MSRLGPGQVSGQTNVIVWVDMGLYVGPDPTPILSHFKAITKIYGLNCLRTIPSISWEEHKSNLGTVSNQMTADAPH